MRAMIQTAIANRIFGDHRLKSRSLLHEGNDSDVEIRKKTSIWLAKSRSLLHEGNDSDRNSRRNDYDRWRRSLDPFYMRAMIQTFGKYEYVLGIWKSRSLLHEGNDSDEDGGNFVLSTFESRSLLHEGNDSDTKTMMLLSASLEVSIPFTWGQWFRPDDDPDGRYVHCIESRSLLHEGNDSDCTRNGNNCWWWSLDPFYMRAMIQTIYISTELDEVSESLDPFYMRAMIQTN